MIYRKTYESIIIPCHRVIGSNKERMYQINY